MRLIYVILLVIVLFCGCNNTPSNRISEQATSHSQADTSSSNQAIVEFDERIRLNPDDALAHFERGMYGRRPQPQHNEMGYWIERHESQIRRILNQED